MDIVNAGSGPLTLEQINDQDYTYFPRDTAIVFIILSTTLYALRLWSRRLNRAKFGFDDSLMIPAYVVQIAFNAVAILSANYGSGRHYLAIVGESPETFTLWGIYNVYVTPYLYELAVTLPKLSILTLYLRIFNDRFSRWACWFIAFILVANVITEYITITLQCDHFQYGWNSWDEPGHCDNIEAHFTWASLPNMITDVAMLLLPLPALRKLQVELRVKVGLGITFLLGSLGLVTGTLRLVGFIQYEIIMDNTWYAGILLFYSILETNMYFISACLLTYRPLLTLLWKELGLSRVVSSISRMSSRSDSKHHSAYSTSHPSGSRQDLESGPLQAPAPGHIRQPGQEASELDGTSVLEPTYHAWAEKAEPVKPQNASQTQSASASRPILSKAEQSWLSFSSKVSSKFSTKTGND